MLTSCVVPCRLFSTLGCQFSNVKIRVPLPTGCLTVCYDHVAQVLSSSMVDGMHSLREPLCHLFEDSWFWFPFSHKRTTSMSESGLELE